MNHLNDHLSTRGRMLFLAAGLFVVLRPLTGMAQLPPAEGPPPAASADVTMPSLWDLAVQGGWFMIPIAIASVVTIAFTLERIVGLRRRRILPPALIHKLRDLMSESSLDPRRVWQAAEQHPSPLANLMKAAILKTGRPHSEVEKSVEDAVQRETGDMTRNLRPINVVASIAPLLGLLGTVQGMILAFMVTSTTTSTGTAKAQELAHGIYTALVTTFAGLTVAVISVVLANFLEGRIERLLQHMESIFLDFLPQLERYEGKIRIVESSNEDEGIRVRQLNGVAEKPVATNTDSETSATRQRPPATSKTRSTKPVRPKEKASQVAEKPGVNEAARAPTAKTLRGHFNG